jgi:hypothetical protein
VEAAANGVVFFTAIPLAALFIVDGLGGQRAGEIVAGLMIAVLIGLPLLLLELRARLRERQSG